MADKVALYYLCIIFWWPCPCCLLSVLGGTGPKFSAVLPGSIDFSVEAGQPFCEEAFTWDGSNHELDR